MPQCSDRERKLTNYTYDEITIGQSATYSKRVEENDVRLFAAVSGDVNPLHLDADYATSTEFGEPIAHGMLTGALISAALAMVLPGPGTIYLSQSLRFRQPVKFGDDITVTLEVVEKNDRRQTITLDCIASNQHGKKVATGSAEVKAPRQKLELKAPALPTER